MEKIRAKRKDFSKSKTVALGYCELQELFNNKQPFAYCAGVYGWDCDLYDVEDIIVSTGYRPVGIRPNNEIIKKYKNKIIEVSNQNYIELSNQNYEARQQSYEKHLEARQQSYEKLLNDFMQEVTK